MSRLAGLRQMVDKSGSEFTEDQGLWVKQAQSYYTQLFLYDEIGRTELQELGAKVRSTIPPSLSCGDYFLGRWGPFGQDLYLLGGVLVLGSLSPCPVCGEAQTFDRNDQTYCVPCGDYVIPPGRGGKNGN